jgi:hypothetical protein
MDVPLPTISTAVAPEPIVTEHFKNSSSPRRLCNE